MVGEFAKELALTSPAVGELRLGIGRGSTERLFDGCPSRPTTERPFRTLQQFLVDLDGRSPNHVYILRTTYACLAAGLVEAGLTSR